MKTTTSIYVTVRIDIEHDDNMKVDELENMKSEVSSEMDYSMSYKQNGIEIIDTEICGINE